MANVFIVRGGRALYGSNVCILMRAYGTRALQTITNTWKISQACSGPFHKQLTGRIQAENYDR